MTRAAPRRRGRPATLSKAKILDAARKSRSEGLSMHGIARTLGVPVTSLYRHFPNRDSVLAAIAEELIADMALPAGEPNKWREWLRASARQMYRTIVRNPLLVENKALPATGASIERQMLPILETLGGAGFTDAQALRMYSGVIGLAHFFASASVEYERSGAEMMGRFQSSLTSSGEKAAQFRVAVAWDESLRDGVEGIFEQNLECLTAGFPEPQSVTRGSPDAAGNRVSRKR